MEQVNLPVLFYGYSHVGGVEPFLVCRDEQDIPRLDLFGCGGYLVLGDIMVFPEIYVVLYPKHFSREKGILFEGGIFLPVSGDETHFVREGDASVFQGDVFYNAV